MKKWTRMLLFGAAIVAVSMAGVTPVLAQAPAETDVKADEYCGICNAKTVVNDVIGDWFTMGADQRIRATYADNWRTMDDNAPNHEFLFQRYRTRVWAKAAPVQDLEIGARLIWEWFNFCKPEAVESTPSSDVPFDELYVKWSNILGAPLSATVGRQGMRLGDGWLVFEGTPLDGSRTVYFDAIRTTFDLADYDTSVNVIWVANRARRDQYIQPFNGSATDDELLDEADRDALILYASNTSQENMTLDGYFIYVHGEEPGTDNNIADLYTLGSRAVGDLSENMKYRAETAIQWGKKERIFFPGLGVGDVNTCLAAGLTTELTYLLMDELDTALHAGYEYRSGGKTPEENFDILFGRYPQFSNILQGQADRLEGGAGALSNFHRFNLGVDMKPMDNSVVLLDWHILFVDNNNMPAGGDFSDSGCLRGNLFTAQWRINHSKHVASTITGELFLPGDFYSAAANDPATFARYEMMLTW